MQCALLQGVCQIYNFEMWKLAGGTFLNYRLAKMAKLWIPQAGHFQSQEHLVIYRFTNQIFAGRTFLNYRLATYKIAKCWISQAEHFWLPTCQISNRWILNFVGRASSEHPLAKWKVLKYKKLTRLKINSSIFSIVYLRMTARTPTEDRQTSRARWTMNVFRNAMRGKPEVLNNFLAIYYYQYFIYKLFE